MHSLVSKSSSFDVALLHIKAIPSATFFNPGVELVAAGRGGKLSFLKGATFSEVVEGDMLTTLIMVDWS